MIDRREIIEPTEAERELGVATKRTAVNEAARRLLRVKTELRAAEQKPNP